MSECEGHRLAPLVAGAEDAKTGTGVCDELSQKLEAIHCSIMPDMDLIKAADFSTPVP